MTKPLAVRERTARCRLCSAWFTAPITAGPGSPFCSDECRKQNRRAKQTAANRRWRLRQKRFLWDVVEGRRPTNAGPLAALNPHDIATVLKLLDKKVRAQVIADRFHVNVRTIYRYARLGMPKQIQVGMFVAWFAPRRQGTPVQITEWVRKAPAAQESDNLLT